MVHSALEAGVMSKRGILCDHPSAGLCLSPWAGPLGLDGDRIQIRGKGAIRLPQARQHNGFLLKPTMLGLSHAVEFAKEAADHKIKAVISSSFETSVGLTALAHLAAALNETVTPAGLDTLGWLSDDVLKTPLVVENGGIDVGGLPMSLELRRHLLKEVRNDG